MPRSAPLALLALLACDSGQLTLVDDGRADDEDSPGVDETDSPTDPGDTDAPSPGDTDPGTPGDTDDSDGTPGDTDVPMTWDGQERRTYQPFFGDACTVTVRLAGERVTGDAARACGACALMFRVETRTTGLCPGVSPFSGDAWRGLEDLGGDDVRVWGVTRDTFGRFSAERLGTGTWIDGALSYAFQDEAQGWRGVRVVGSATVE